MQKLLFLLIFSLNIVFLNAQIVFSEPLDLSITSEMDYCLLRVDTTSLIISDEDYNGILNSDETLYVVFKLKSIGTQKEISSLTACKGVLTYEGNTMGVDITDNFGDTLIFQDEIRLSVMVKASDYITNGEIKFVFDIESDKCNIFDFKPFKFSIKTRR